MEEASKMVTIALGAILFGTCLGTLYSTYWNPGEGFLIGGLILGGLAMIAGYFSNVINFKELLKKIKKKKN